MKDGPQDSVRARTMRERLAGSGLLGPEKRGSRQYEVYLCFSDFADKWSRIEIRQQVECRPAQKPYSNSLPKSLIPCRQFR
jgi:hypothetical protein